jgi:DNA (cytosine-5)-methyltransferase 1
VLLENVPFMLHLDRGRAFAYIVGKLEELGFRWAYRVVDTQAFGLPQRRERVFVLASLEDDPRDVLLADDIGEPPSTGEVNGSACGFYWTEGTKGLGWAVDAIPPLKGGSTVGVPSPPAIWLPTGAIVTPEIRDAERLQGFPRNWTRPAEEISKRGARWRLVGNAVSVPVARWLGERLAMPGIFEPKGVKPLYGRTQWPRAAWNIGEGRFAAAVSAWPKRRKRQALVKFLAYEGKPLSEKATKGFYLRACDSSLHFVPRFLKAVEKHLEKMRRE